MSIAWDPRAIGDDVWLRLHAVAIAELAARLEDARRDAIGREAQRLDAEISSAWDAAFAFWAEAVTGQRPMLPTTPIGGDDVASGLATTVIRPSRPPEV